MSGLNPTLRDLFLEMVITSDDTATDVMLKRRRRTQASNAWLERPDSCDCGCSAASGLLPRLHGRLEPRSDRCGCADIRGDDGTAPRRERAIPGTVAAAYKKLDAMSADEGNKIAPGFYRDPTLRLVRSQPLESAASSRVSRRPLWYRRPMRRKFHPPDEMAKVGRAQDAALHRHAVHSIAHRLETVHRRSPMTSVSCTWLTVRR